MRELYVDGRKVLFSPNWSVNSRINARTTASFTIPIVHTNTDIEIDTGDDVKLYNNSELLFAGIVNDVQRSLNRSTLEWSISCVDYSILADKILVYRTYKDKTLVEIISDLIEKFFGTEGITAGDIANGIVVKKAVFNYINGTQVLDYLKTATGLNWKVDNYKKLHFFKNENRTAPWVLNDKSYISRFRENKNKSEYRNRQFVRGGLGRTNTIQIENPSPKPDGESKNFIVRFPVAEKPEIYINGTKVDDNLVGVNGLDRNKHWYFSFNSNVISQDNQIEPLKSTDTLQVKYTGLYPILTVVDSPNEISNRKEKETGTSGKYEAITVEKSIDESSQAIEYAQGLLLKYGRIPSKVTFATEVSGLEAGQLLKIERSQFNINASYLIESVNYSVIGNNILYNVTCLDGTALGGWEEFFKSLVNKATTVVIGENEVLVFMNLTQETLAFAGQFELEGYSVIYPSENLFPSDNLYPGTVAWRDNIND